MYSDKRSKSSGSPEAYREKGNSDSDYLSSSGQGYIHSDRRNMSYQQNNYRNNGNGYEYRSRINEDQVPESKHTIFIRGLPGTIEPDEVKDYFEDKIGPVSFDFVKVSPDQQRLFVAVRFESRDDAKDAMSRYKDHELLGHRCELSWFKDIRRYAQYQAAQGNPIVRGNFPRGRGSFRGNNGRGYQNQARGYNNYDRDGYKRRDSRDRSRSRSDRSDSSRSKSRTRSPPSSRRSRSKSGRRSSSNESKHSRKASDRESSVDDERRKRKREKKTTSATKKPTGSKRSKRSRSSSMSVSDNSRSPSVSSITNSKNRSGIAREPTASPISNRDSSRSPSPPLRKAPSPLEVQVPIAPPQPVAQLKFKLKPREEPMPEPTVPSPAVVLQSTTFNVDMETDDPPRKIIRKLSPDNGTEKEIRPPPIPPILDGIKSGLKEEEEYRKRLEAQRAALLPSVLPPPPCPPLLTKDPTPPPPAPPPPAPAPAHAPAPAPAPVPIFIPTQASHKVSNIPAPTPVSTIPTPTPVSAIPAPTPAPVISTPAPPPPVAPPATPPQPIKTNSFRPVEEVTPPIIPQYIPIPPQQIPIPPSPQTLKSDIYEDTAAALRKQEQEAQARELKRRESMSSTPKNAASKYPTTGRLFAELKTIQSKIIQSVKPEPKEEESFGGLRLSSLATQMDDEEDVNKLRIREQKLSELDETAMQRFMVKKKQLETAYRNDCETFAFVTRKLLSKDSSLEQALRIALIENMDDLEKQLMDKVDAYLD